MLVTKTIDSNTMAVICTDTAYQQVVINYSPCASSISTTNNGGGSYTFTATNLSGTAGLSYSWYFGDGSTGTGSPITHSYASSGNNYVTLTTTGSGCTSTVSTWVNYIDSTINCDSLHANFIPNIAGLSVGFANNSTFNYNLASLNVFSIADWYFGDGSSQLAAQYGYHVYAAAGTYNVTMVNKWKDTTTGQLYCVDTFVYPITLTVPTVSCDSLSASFTTSISGPTVYFTNTSTYLGNNVSNQSDWYFGDGGSQTGSYGGASHTYASPGTYTVFMLNRWVDSFTNQLYCTDSVAMQVTVSNINYIGGYIQLDSSVYNPSYSDSFKIWLITYDSSANSLTAVDSVYSSGYFPYYQFDNKPAGDYLVKAAFLGQAVGATGFVPTYHLSSIYWGSATNIAHSGGITSGKDIIMQTGTVTSGPGFVGGNISMGAGKGTGTGVAGMQVYLRGANNVLVASSVTDDDGNFSFSNIPVGAYNVYPEAMNYNTTPYNTINVSASQSHVTSIDFEQKNNLIYPKGSGTTGISNVTKADGLHIYPNPAKTQLFIENNNNLFNTVHIVNTLGQTIQQNKLVNGINKIGLTNINSGIYYLLISGPEGSRSQKIIKE